MARCNAPVPPAAVPESIKATGGRALPPVDRRLHEWKLETVETLTQVDIQLSIYIFLYRYIYKWKYIYIYTYIYIFNKKIYIIKQHYLAGMNNTLLNCY